MHLNGEKNRKMSFNGRKLARNEQMDRRFMYMYMTKIFKHPSSVVVVVVVVVHTFQSSSSLKPLDQSSSSFMWSILRKGGTKVCINGPGHLTKMAARAINSKSL